MKFSFKCHGIKDVVVFILIASLKYIPHPMDDVRSQPMFGINRKL